MVATIRETLNITLLYQGFDRLLQLLPLNSRFLATNPRISAFEDKKVSFGGVIGGVIGGGCLKLISILDYH